MLKKFIITISIIIIIIFMKFRYLEISFQEVNGFTLESTQITLLDSPLLVNISK